MEPRPTRAHPSRVRIAPGSPDASRAASQMRVALGKSAGSITRSRPAAARPAASRTSTPIWGGSETVEPGGRRKYTGTATSRPRPASPVRRRAARSVNDAGSRPLEIAVSRPSQGGLTEERWGGRGRAARGPGPARPTRSGAAARPGGRRRSRHPVPAAKIREPSWARASARSACLVSASASSETRARSAATWFSSSRIRWIPASETPSSCDSRCTSRSSATSRPE